MAIGDSVNGGFVYWIDGADPNHVKIAAKAWSAYDNATISNGPLASNLGGMIPGINPNLGPFGTGSVVVDPPWLVYPFACDGEVLTNCESHIDGFANTQSLMNQWAVGWCGATPPFSYANDDGGHSRSIYKEMYLNHTILSSFDWHVPAIDELVEATSALGALSSASAFSSWTSVYPSSTQVSAAEEANGCFDLNGNSLVDFKDASSPTQADNVWGVRTEGDSTNQTVLFADTIILPKRVWNAWLLIKETYISPPCNSGCVFLINNYIFNAASAVGAADGTISWQWWGQPGLCTAPFTVIVTNVSTGAVHSTTTVNTVGTNASPNVETANNVIGGDIYQIEVSPTGDPGCVTITQQAVIISSIICAETYPVIDSPAINNVTTFGGNDGDVLLPFHYENASGAQVPVVYGTTCGLISLLEYDSAQTGNFITYQTPPVLFNSGTTSTSFSNLAAGDYRFTITDCYGCFDVIIFTITEPGDPCNTSTLNATYGIGSNPTCPPGNIYSGDVTISPSGGVPPYSILLVNYPTCYSSSPTPQLAGYTNITTNLNYPGICSGSYMFEIMDSMGCTKKLAVALHCSPCSLSASTTITQPDCDSGIDVVTLGECSVNVLGGGGNYDYTLTGNTTIGPFSSGSSYTFANITPDNYTLTVTDPTTGCTTTSTVNITAPPPIVVTGLVSNVTLYGLSDGSITTTITGGVSPYSYSWNTGDITQHLTGIPVGVYTITVIDANGCESIATFVLEQPPCNMLVFGTVSGITGDPNSTSSTATATIDVDSATILNYDGLRFLIDIPDGSGNFAYYEIWFDATGSTAAPTAVSGYTQVEADISASTTVSDIAGVIEVALALSNITVTRTADIISITFDKTGASALAHASTNGTTASLLALSLTSQTSCDGSINLYNPTGGIFPYSYSWTGPNGYTASTQDISGLCVGYYTVMICDVSGTCCAEARFLVMPGDCITSEDADDAIEYINSICHRCGCDVVVTEEDVPQSITQERIAEKTFTIKSSHGNNIVIEEQSNIKPRPIKHEGKIIDLEAETVEKLIEKMKKESDLAMYTPKQIEDGMLEVKKTLHLYNHERPVFHELPSEKKKGIGCKKCGDTGFIGICVFGGCFECYVGYYKWKKRF